MNTDFKAPSFHTILNEKYFFCAVTLDLLESGYIVMLTVDT